MQLFGLVKMERRRLAHPRSCAKGHTGSPLQGRRLTAPARLPCGTFSRHKGRRDVRKWPDATYHRANLRACSPYMPTLTVAPPLIRPAAPATFSPQEAGKGSTSPLLARLRHARGIVHARLPALTSPAVRSCCVFKRIIAESGSLESSLAGSTLEDARARGNHSAWIAIMWLASLGAFLQEAEWAPLVADDAEL